MSERNTRSGLANASQERFLGAMLGMAIGDAFGMPVNDLTPAEIESRHGPLRGYLPVEFPDGTRLEPGEFSDETEVALCIVEGYTASGGLLDVNQIGARLDYLIRGESKRWMTADTVRAIEIAAAWGDFTLPVITAAPTPDVAARGVPVGLMHSIGEFSLDALAADARAMARLTDASEAAADGVAAVAYVTALTARGDSTVADAVDRMQSIGLNQTLHDAIDRAMTNQTRVSKGSTGELANSASSNSIESVIGSALSIAANARSLVDAVSSAAGLGGAADSRASLAGAFYGAAFGARAVPQSMIDGLQGRIYLSLAVPWLYRTVLSQRGTSVPIVRAFE